MNTQREKTEQGIERRVEKSRRKKIGGKNRKEQQEQTTTHFEILDWINIEKGGEIKIE